MEIASTKDLQVSQLAGGLYAVDGVICRSWSEAQKMMATAFGIAPSKRPAKPKPDPRVTETKKK